MECLTTKECLTAVEQGSPVYRVSPRSGNSPGVYAGVALHENTDWRGPFTGLHATLA